MANARVIRRNFFNDPLVAGKFNIEQRYFLIGIACASDDYGRFWWNPSNLKSTIYPTDNKQLKWIEKTLNLFISNDILCKYEVNGVQFGHFPHWFDKSFSLKQRLDHPKPEQLPDCGIHIMNEKNTRKKRESSQPNKININKTNLNNSDDGNNNSNRRKYYPKDFKLDTTGNSYMGYCDKCNKSDFYDRHTVWGDSKCCNSLLIPNRKD